MKPSLLDSALRTIHLILVATVLLLARHNTSANSARDGTGAGPNVTVADNGDGTVTMTNGIASVVMVKKTGRLNSLTYTYTTDGTTRTCETLSGKGQYYYGGACLGHAGFCIFPGWGPRDP